MIRPLPNDIVAEILRYYMCMRYVGFSSFCYICMVLKRSACGIQQISQIYKMVFINEQLVMNYIDIILRSNDMRSYNMFACSLNRDVFNNVREQIVARRGNRDLIDHIIRRIYNMRVVTATEIKFYIDYDPQLTNAKDNNGQTICLAACYTNQEEIIKVVGLDINEKDNLEWSPLMIACKYQRIRLVKLLVGCGAKIDVANNFLQTPLMIACENGRVDIVKLLIKKSDINAKDDRGFTALIYNVSGRCNMRIVKQIATTANVNEKTMYGDTALMYAAKYGYLKCVKFLISVGADVNAKDDENMTVLMFACRSHREEIVDLLLQSGANIHEKNNIGWTALMYACYENHIKIAKQLIQVGANIHEKNEDGYTALMIAERYVYTDIVDMLLAADTTE